MHQNSLSAYQELDRESRQAKVLSVYLESASPLSDKQVRDILHLRERNEVSPRITELRDMFDLIEVGKVYDAESGCKVRICRVTTSEEKARLIAEKHGICVKVDDTGKQFEFSMPVKKHSDPS